MSEDLFLRCGEDVKKRYLSIPRLKRELQATLEGEAEYCVIDFETTGFDPLRDRVIEVAAARVAGGEVRDRCASLIHPGCSIPPYIRALTGIDDEMVSGCPTVEAFFPTLMEFIADLPVVAYSRFEWAFLRELYSSFAGIRFENPYIDAMDLAIMVMPCLRRHRQADLASIWGLDTGNAHRAGDDVDTLVGVFDILLNGLYNMPLQVVRAVSEHGPAQPGGLSLLLSRVLEERSGGRPVERLKLDELTRGDSGWEEVPPLEGVHEAMATPPRPGVLRAFFAADGPLSRQFGDYEGRDEQVEMALAVRSAFEEGEVLLVEAGTGTGKSLAYLAPAVLWSLATSAPVVVSTRTLNLQDQLFTKDLPLLEAAMGEGSFRYSVLKGYGNYVCLRKLQGLVNSRKNLAENQLGILGMLITWLGEGGNGDVSLLNVSHLRGLNYHVLADHRECPGDRCSFARKGCCFYRKAIHRAKRSHIVVVNHSLILAGANIQFERAVVDEAHTLEDVATEQFTVEVDYRETRKFLEFLYSPLEGAGFLVDLSAAMADHIEPDASAGAVQLASVANDGVEECLEGLERVFIALSEFYEGDTPGMSDIRFTPAFADSVRYLRLQATVHELVVSIEDLLLRLARLSQVCADRGDGTSEIEYLSSDLAGKLTRLSELKEGLGRVLSLEADGLVRWATVAHPSRFEIQALKASPVDVGPSLKECLYDELGSLVMTSATLTVKNSFDFFCSRVGLDLIDADRLRSLVLDSSFDFERQMQILILHDMPEPGSREYEDRLPGVLGEVIRASAGGVLALFTNRRLMLETYAAVADELLRDGLPVLCQQPGYSRRRLAEEFVEDDATSLFGTSSFWEGVDARGDTLRLVAVTRIPFESPGRPVFEARSELVREQGLSDFSSLSLPLAALRLKQGVGRLIRTRQDAGQVLIIDSRIGSKQYGQVLLRSLPRARRRKVSLDEVGRAVADFHRRST